MWGCVGWLVNITATVCFSFSILRRWGKSSRNNFLQEQLPLCLTSQKSKYLQMLVKPKLSVDNLTFVLFLRLKAKSRCKLSFAYYSSVRSNTNASIYAVCSLCTILETMSLSVLYVVVFAIVASFSHMEDAAQQGTPVRCGCGTLISIFQKSCCGWPNVCDFSDQFSVLLSQSISIFAFACIKQEIQMLVINWSSPAASPDPVPKSPVYCYLGIC